MARKMRDKMEKGKKEKTIQKSAKHSLHVFMCLFIEPLFFVELNPLNELWVRKHSRC